MQPSYRQQRRHGHSVNHTARSPAHPQMECSTALFAPVVIPPGVGRKAGARHAFVSE
jgi:hypothetical protein